MAKRVRFSPPAWLFLIVLAIVIAGPLFWLNSYRHRFVQSDADLVRLLPRGDFTVCFGNLALLRRAGMMQALSGAKPARDKDYDAFVQQTGLDYTTDVDAIAAAIGRNGIFCTAKGRFDWESIRRYIVARGGTCSGAEFCRVPSSTPGRWASLTLVQPDVIGLAVSTEASAAKRLAGPGHRTSGMVSSAPVWVDVSPSLLSNPANLTLPLRIFAIDMQSADSVVLSLVPPGVNQDAAFEIQLDAVCPNPVTAATIRTQLELQTKMLKLELAREHATSNAADLTGLLTAGSFQVSGRRVIGSWPVRHELLKALQ